MTRTFRISAKEIKKKDGTGSFISCSAKIGEKWYRVKFTKDCERSPKKRGLYDLTVKSEHMSVQKGKIKDGFTENDILWISEIETLRRYTEEELNEMNEAKLSEVFGGTKEVDPDDLTF